MEKGKRQQEEPLTEQAKLLIRYLEQYRTCTRRKKMLEVRRRRIVNEFNSPLTAMRYDGMPKGSRTSVGAAGLAIRLDEIDTRILQQTEKCAKILLEVMNVLEFLPENEIERDILEQRFIDCTSWERICGKVHITRTPAYKHFKTGIYKLLEFKKVQKILEDYKAELAELGEVI